MAGRDLLRGKKILVVDDERDVLETLAEILTMCEVVTASSFEEAKDLLETQRFHLAILDIMGVNGYELLALCKQKGVTAAMLTSHALTPGNIVTSYKAGAASFIPKDRMSEIVLFLNDILEAQEEAGNFWRQWALRLGDRYWESRFGPRWKEEDKEFWKDFPDR